MAAVDNIGFSNLHFFVANTVETTNMHRHTNFIKIGQMVAKILHLTIFKMVAVCRFTFS